MPAAKRNRREAAYKGLILGIVAMLLKDLRNKRHLHAEYTIFGMEIKEVTGLKYPVVRESLL